MEGISIVLGLFFEMHKECLLESHTNPGLGALKLLHPHPPKYVQGGGSCKTEGVIHSCGVDDAHTHTHTLTHLFKIP